MCSLPAIFGVAAKYAAILFQKAPDLCSFPTTGYFLVFNHELMSTTSYVGVHVLHSLRSAGGSSPKFEASVPWVPKTWTCDEDSSTLSWTKPKTVSYCLLRSSTNFWLLRIWIGIHIRICQKREKEKNNVFDRWKRRRIVFYRRKKENNICV